ncbi:hypothetical protein PVAP13_5NG436940 [Panicum virgatum]|uniref:BHLH domain-containing protein n=1 Tax=Panicum virgatum TaxID=38727 RepID=A0A8T0S2F3_PANVG|nr:hypothetical protein PVAP13_5NG436940 [Panicum virgatum]KAG2591228.1 hypothetical protein PVAP13_5NG436940 [Panicum virgatum]
MALLQHQHYQRRRRLEVEEEVRRQMFIGVAAFPTAALVLGHAQQAGLGTVTRACRSRNRCRRGSTGGPAANGAAPLRCITSPRRCCSLPFLERRSKINKKMKALQSLIPNSNKTMLDEAIEYLKQLQLQVQASKMSA